MRTRRKPVVARWKRGAVRWPWCQCAAKVTIRETCAVVAGTSPARLRHATPFVPKGGPHPLFASPESRQIAHLGRWRREEVALREVDAGRKQHRHAGGFLDPFDHGALAGGVCLRTKRAHLLLVLR